MHTIHKRFRLLPLRHLPYALGHREVGQRHKLLDEFVGVFRFFEIHAYRVSVLVDFKTHLGAVELGACVVISAAARLFRELVKSENLTREVTFAGLYYLLSLLICEPAVSLMTVRPIR